MMQLLLEGKRALVCGVATKESIAWGIAKALHSHGARIALTCLPTNARRVKRLAQEVNCDAVIPCDVRNEEDITRLLDGVASVFDGKLEVLVHSIAYANPEDLEGEFICISRSRWQEALDISAYSLVALARAARPLMVSAGGGSIVSLTFVGGERVVPGYNIMGVAKAALNAVTMYLAHDLGPENIRVNAISAGPIPTPSARMVENFATLLDSHSRISPLRRNMSLEDLGGVAVFLASDLSSGVTGKVITVDAGAASMLLAGSSPQHDLK